MDEDLQDDDVHVGLSSVVVVEKKDLDNLGIPFDESNEDDSPHRKKRKAETEEDASGESSLFELQRLKFTDEEEDEYESTAQPSTSAVALGRSARCASQNSDDEIGKITAQFMEGRLSLIEFASAMEDYEKFKQDVESSNTTSEATLGYLNPEAVDIKPSLPPIFPSEGNAEGSENRAAKLSEGFYASGNDPVPFSVRRKRKMPTTISNMMGEANLRYITKDLAKCESICLEIIKEQPTYTDPYHTLAMMYESQGRFQECITYYFICGLLDPKKFHDWPKLAKLLIQEGNFEHALMCLNKAIARDQSDIDLYVTRSEVMAEMSDYNGALRGYHTVLTLADKNGPAYMDTSKRIAAIHFKTGDVEKAYEALSEAVNKFGDEVTTVELNLLVEVCISLKRYVKAITLFMRFSGVKFEPSIAKLAFKERNSLMTALHESDRKCIVPKELHTDLVQKLCIVLIHLEGFKMVEPIVEGLHASQTINDFGLQFYEIAEAYIAKQQHEPALKILTVLTTSEKYKAAAEIWLRYAECLFLLNQIDKSAEAYSTVIKLAPGHKIARLNLSVILQRQGKFEGALKSLDQDEMEDLIDQELLVEKCNILLSRNRIEEFYESALQLFSRHCPKIRNNDEVHAMVITGHTNQQLEGLRALRAKKGEPLEDDNMLQFEDKTNENLIGEWNIYLNLLQIFLKNNRIDLYSRVAYTAWASKLFSADEKMKKDLDLHVTLAAILSSDVELTPFHIRILFARYGTAAIILNLLTIASRRCGHTRYGRKMVYLLMKNPKDTRIMMLSAHNSFMNGTYKYALMEYFALLKVTPEDPLVYLMIASTFLHIGSQKFAGGNRSQLMVHAIAFLNQYAELRGECQETFYNMGRILHYMGLYKQAMLYYKRVLLTEPVDDRSNAEYNISDLKREAAFNIAQIYRSSKCWELARQYIHRYIVI